jgi:hypothetical protein
MTAALSDGGFQRRRDLNRVSRKSVHWRTWISLKRDCHGRDLDSPGGTAPDGTLSLSFPPSFPVFSQGATQSTGEATLFLCSRQLAKLGGEPTTARPLDIHFGAPSRAANSRAGGSPDRGDIHFVRFSGENRSRRLFRPASDSDIHSVKRERRLGLLSRQSPFQELSIAMTVH